MVFDTAEALTRNITARAKVEINVAADSVTDATENPDVFFRPRKASTGKRLAGASQTW